MKEYDIAVVGGGLSGYTAALQAASVGARTCLVEKDQLGSAFLYRGSFRLHTVLGWLRVLESIQPASQVGISIAKNGAPDLENLFNRSGEAAEAQAASWQKNLEEKGVSLKFGIGRLAGKKELIVGEEGKEEIIKSEKIILAPGSVPCSNPSIPFDHERILSPDDIHCLKEIPETILIVGGGKVGCEIATLMNKLGSKVFVSEVETRLLPNFDPEITTRLEGVMKKNKVKLLLNKKIISYLKTDQQIEITLDGSVKFSVKKMVLLGDRSPATKDIHLDGTGIRSGEYGEIWINDSMETSTPGIFAIGTATGRNFSTYHSEREARVAVSSALGKARSISEEIIPLTIHCDPEIASVGCFEEEAHHKGFRAVCGSAGGGPYSALDENSLIKIVADRESKKIIGAHILGSHAADLISLLVLAMRKDLTVGALANISCDWPSPWQGVREAAQSIVKPMAARP
ncbi:MAG: dihydrolipoyl dehydrogenase family protein [Nitrospinales bacterium]